MNSLTRIARRSLVTTKTNPMYETSPVDLEMLDVDLFRSKALWRPAGSNAVYGGQVCGQALAASAKCAEAPKELHSLHSYFMKAGNPDIPILYRVRKLNVTNNFEVHAISAKQKGQTIFACQASYHRPEESTLFHERTIPDAPRPETLKSSEERLTELLTDSRTPESFKSLIRLALDQPFPLDVREVDPQDFFKPNKVPSARKLVWMKALFPVGAHDINMQRVLAAYASDWGLGVSSLLPHGITWPSPKIKICTSLDHSMWFHAPFRADEWMLYDMSSVKLSNARGMNHCYIYNANGELAITASQETLIRMNTKKPQAPPTAPPS